jgi:hypothetical protein
VRANSASSLIIALLMGFSLPVFAQSNVPAPDPLSVEEPPLGVEEPPLGPAARIESEETTESLEEAVEQSREPVPLIKRRKNMDEALKEKRFIEHPNAEKGLIRIDKNRVYYYKVKESEQKGAANVKFAMYEPTELSNPNNSSISYENIYDEDAFPMILYEHEWQIWQKFGKFGLTAGGGLFFAQGRGQFEDSSVGERAREKFTLIAFPLSVGVVYRMQYWDSQPLVPYGGAALDYIAFAERRDDDQNPAFGAALGGAPASHFYAGVAVQLGTGARSFLDLDREYGINRIWLTGEFRQYVGLDAVYDFTGDAFNAGMTAEF